jgi:chaperone required for assembly of F1-ATPase
MKRFWREVSVAAAGDGWGIRLDARPLRTPARRPLVMPTEALASAVAEEWRAQRAEVDAASMPLTRLATTVIDLMPARRADAVAEAVGFAGTDLLCYRAEAPVELAVRQAKAWQPWLDWAERTLGARLEATVGVVAIAQDPAALASLAARVEALDDWRLVGLHAAVTLSGSLILGLAVEAGALTSEAAFPLALLDELFEIERWGEEAEQKRRHATLRRDLDAASRFLDLIR